MDGVYNLSLKFLLETPGGEPCPICGKEWKAMAFDWMPFSVGVVIDQTRAPVCRSCAADYSPLLEALATLSETVIRPKQFDIEAMPNVMEAASDYRAAALVAWEIETIDHEMKRG